MTLPHLLVFLGTSIVITVAPGPDNLQVLARGIAQGRAAGLVAASGFASGLLFHTTLAALGLAAVLRASPWAFQGIRLAGAAYLIWIGLKALTSRAGLGVAHGQAGRPLWQVYRQSVLGNLMNPKVTLFFLVFLPQFVDARAGRPSLQMFMLGLAFMLQTVIIFGAYGWFAGALGAWLKRRPGAGRWLDRAAGATFIALGVRVALPG